MIKPVKRNKRLKWIDSHYAINCIIGDWIDRLIYQTAVDWGCPVDMILGKSCELLSDQEKADLSNIVNNQWQDKKQILDFLSPSP